jgi:hypothetical protein
MSKVARFWDWLLPSLICLCPMGAVAYYSANAENEVTRQESARTGRGGVVSHPLVGAVVIPIARL